MIAQRRELAVLSIESRERDVAALAGTKARSLHRLAQRGIPVPRWAVVGADVLRAFRAHAGLDERIAATLSGVTTETSGAVARRIADAFAHAEIDAASARAIEQAYALVGAGSVAVRSSGLDEDGDRHSFAGQYESTLNVIGAAPVVAHVKACWASAYSERALRYRLQHRLPCGVVDMGVIVQEIVRAEKSGVIFTINPISGRRDEIVISAVYGLGDGLVSGAVDADTLVVARATGRVCETVVGDKRERVEASRDECGTVVRAVDAGARSSLCLEPREIADLRSLVERVESAFGAPQDIEWSIAGGEVWVLQSRPVTATGDADGGELRIWDNSNIIESYGEITAPLTFSFARHAYHRVYRDYAELLGVPQRHLARMEAWLPNMLGSFNGRVYYNLLNWYKVIRLLPFYRLNRRVLELSMGVQEPLSDDLAERQRAIESTARIEDLALRALFAIRFAWFFFTIQRSVKRFLRDFYRVYDEFDAIDYFGWPAEEAYRCYRDIERRLLARWGRMILLEATIGLAYGTLHLLTTRWMPDAPEWLKWEVAKVDEDVESAQPAHRLAELASLAREHRELTELLRATAPEATREALERAGSKAAERLLAAVDRFLDEFGYRNVNELKLEEPDLREDPSMLFALLRGQLEQDAQPRHPGAGPAGRTADEYLNAHLRGWRRGAYELMRRKVRRTLAARERVRFCRTRAFGMARRIFKAIGVDLARVGAIPSAHDIFYLRLEELHGCFDGTISHRELWPLIELRKAQEAEHRRLVAPPRFTTRGSVYWGELERQWRAHDATCADADTGAGGGRVELYGTPSTQGVATGEARVVDRPVDAGGNVLVTYRTDPGWVPVLASASGLLIERGSPLTHVAIVARELGIPTVVQIPGLTRRIRTGMWLTVDGATGQVLADDMQ
jgi:pyruvate,water dikinase